MLTNIDRQMIGINFIKAIHDVFGFVVSKNSFVNIYIYYNISLKQIFKEIYEGKYISYYMRLEIIIIAITAVFIYNVYYDGNILKKIYSYKKYFTMGIIAIIGISIYLLIKRDPMQSKKILLYANNMIKYMPIDKQTMNFISPIIDFTSPKDNSGFMMGMNNNSQSPTKGFNGSGGSATKRSVSETKKKYVASQQHWKCGECHQQLNHTFEIDNRVRLEYGGGNNVENLVALCRNCHGEKTASENM